MNLVTGCSTSSKKGMLLRKGMCFHNPTLDSLTFPPPKCQNTDEILVSRVPFVFRNVKCNALVRQKILEKCPRLESPPPLTYSLITSDSRLDIYCGALYERTSRDVTLHRLRRPAGDMQMDGRPCFAAKFHAKREYRWCFETILHRCGASYFGQ
jgi:hypothetical protein